MLKETFSRWYPVQKGTNESSLSIVNHDQAPLRLAQYSDSAFEYWIMRNAQINLPTSCEPFREFIAIHLEDLFKGEKILSHISRVNLFPDRIIVVFVCDEFERLEVDYEVAIERYAVLRSLHGLPEDEYEDESENEHKAAELWYDASHESDGEYAARIGSLFPELEGHAETITEEIEVCLTGKAYLHLEEKFSQGKNEYTMRLEDTGLNLRIQRGDRYSVRDLFNGKFGWGKADKSIMIGTIHKDHLEHILF